MKLSIYIGAGLIAGLGIVTSALADSLDSKAREGVTHYNREEFDQAAAKFEASQLEKPDNSAVAYNLANSHYRLGRYEAAVEAYRDALSENASPELRQKSWYNMGNAYYRMGYMDEAIASYKKALELNPGDMDSKFNLEWTRKQHEKAVKSGQAGPRNKNLHGERDPNARGNNPPSPLKEEREETQTAKNPPRDKPDSPEKPRSSSSQLPAGEEPTEEDRAVQEALQEMTKMSPEEAERWLGSLSEDLKKIARRQMQGTMKDMFVDHDKDW